MAKPEWGERRKCLECGTAFYDFMKEPPVCPKCGASLEEKEVIEELESKEDDIPENEDEVVIDEMASMEEDEEDQGYGELDVEGDLQQIEPSLVNDDDIDNVFVEDSVDLGDIEEDLKKTIEEDPDSKI